MMRKVMLEVLKRAHFVQLYGDLGHFEFDEHRNAPRAGIFLLIRWPIRVPVGTYLKGLVKKVKRAFVTDTNSKWPKSH